MKSKSSLRILGKKIENNIDAIGICERQGTVPGGPLVWPNTARRLGRCSGNTACRRDCAGPWRSSVSRWGNVTDFCGFRGGDMDQEFRILGREVVPSCPHPPRESVLRCWLMYTRNDLFRCFEIWVLSCRSIDQHDFCSLAAFFLTLNVIITWS